MQQEAIIEALMDPAAYDEEIRYIKMLQTHISYIILTGKYAYKIKKPVDFGFLDFTTLEKRRFYCEEEVRLNRRLCGDMYVGVLPVTISDGSVKIGGSGRTVEYTVKMRELPQEALMSRLLDRDEVTADIMDQIARILSEFHRKAETNREIESYGSIRILRFNWDENFDQTGEFIGRTIRKGDYDFIRRAVRGFLDGRRGLFKLRRDKGRIRECHGDLHSGNIFIADRIYIYDAIEFNKRFRYCDVASDIAFLLMDLEFLSKESLSIRFLDRYIEYSGEKEDFLEVLPFYKCYRAYVRGKVTSFKLNDPNIPEEEKETSRQMAERYFWMSRQYAEQMIRGIS
ncbi:MAG: kinase [Candidatus Bathyarchaeota archaeon B63]|nr:MAG: kinase [Candidatus Bathyarchaeota archaeon B63]